ncbi:MAG: PfkB family carbohydrate kinase [bacterium]
MATGSVVVVGSVALDTIEGTGGRATSILGGSATFASVAASYFAPTKLLACIGEDFPAADLKVFEERGIDVSGLARLPGKTFRWTGIYAHGFRGRETLSLDLGVFLQFAPVLGGPLPKGSILLLGNIDPDLQLTVLDQAGPDAFVAADTIDHWIKSKRGTLLKGLARTHLFFLNDQEAELLTGETNLVVAGAAIRKMGPRLVVIKKGEHGALLFGDEGLSIVPALPLERVVDPTGAGDVFAGAMLGSLARDGARDLASMRLAMARGTVMSSFAVEDFSVRRLRGLTPADIEERLARLRSLVKF